MWRCWRGESQGAFPALWSRNRQPETDVAFSAPGRSAPPPHRPAAPAVVNPGTAPHDPITAGWWPFRVVCRTLGIITFAVAVLAPLGHVAGEVVNPQVVRLSAPHILALFA